MTKYQTLLNILDQIRLEGSTYFQAKYTSSNNKLEQVNQERSRAFIHLYLKVGFGLLDFRQREHFVTDGTNDGGIDGYFINKESKTIYFIQSKFRTNEKNFEEKKIELEEILVMDVNRILDGEDVDENGNFYNGKIKQITREIQLLEDVARYSYRVVILANLSKLTDTKLRQLAGGFSVEVVDYEECYNKLIFPVITGTYFNATDLNINIDLSNKNAGTKISYTVQTKKGYCEITVLFAPTIEIAKLMYKYKNSILKYNPRSYLDFEGKKVNNAIRETILNNNTNEFALFNNGITMLSDETYINEKIGQKNKAVLTVKNPQIINGGQTSFTLSRIFQEYESGNADVIFQNKEVLLKIITLIEKNDDKDKIELIEEISTATNQQTPVITSDKFSNEKVQVELQRILFDRYGVLYERKRGEFGDGIYNSYILQSQIIERNLFFRIYYAANGKIGLSKQKKLFLKQEFDDDTLKDISKLDNFYFGLLIFSKLYKARNSNQKIEVSIYAKIYAFTKLYASKNLEEFENLINNGEENFEKRWSKFLSSATKAPNLLKKKKDKITGEFVEHQVFSQNLWYESDEFEKELRSHFALEV